MYEVIDRLVDAGSWLRDQGALRRRDHRGAGAARRAGGRASWPTSPRSRAACCWWTPPTRRRGSSGSATRTTFRSSTWPTSRASWSAPRSSARGSSATAPRWSSRPRRRPCRRSASSSASATARGSTRCAGRPSSPTPCWRCPRARSRSWGRSPPSTPSTTTRSWSCRRASAAAFVKAKRDEYAKDVDVYKLASEMLVDDIVPGSELRAELIKRLGYAETKAAALPAAPQPRAAGLARAARPRRAGRAVSAWTCRHRGDTVPGRSDPRARQPLAVVSGTIGVGLARSGAHL